MDSRAIAEKARNLAIMVKVQGPDPQGLKMRGSAFHQRENGITMLSASGFLLPPSLIDSLPPLSSRQHKGALAVTVASVVDPFLPAQYRNLSYQNSTAVQVGVPGLIPGARIDVLLESNNPERGHDGPGESLAWHQAQLVTIVDVSVSSTALELLMRSNRAASNYSSWEVGWKLVSLNSSPDSSLDSLQREFKASGNKPKSDGQLDFTLNESTSLHQMAMSATKIAFLEILTLDSKDLLNVNISHQQKRGDFLLAIGSPFGVLSPSHFLNRIVCRSLLDHWLYFRSRDRFECPNNKADIKPGTLALLFLTENGDCYKRVPPLRDVGRPNCVPSYPFFLRRLISGLNQGFLWQSELVRFARITSYHGGSDPQCELMRIGRIQPDAVRCAPTSELIRQKCP